MTPRITPSPGTTRLKADLTLLLVSVIWGSAFVAQRVAAEQMGVYLFNGLRFLLGALVLLPLALRRQSQGARPTWKTLLWMLLAGALIFTGASLQQLGMRYTTAGNAGFITGLYVVLIPIILVVGWRQPPRPVIWVAAALATLGLFLLSTGGRFALAGLKGALLICHGVVDVNVHFQDAVRLVQSLIELKKERWELAVYPVEDHGFREPTSWRDEYLRILRLFDTNLLLH